MWKEKKEKTPVQKFFKRLFTIIFLAIFLGLVTSYVGTIARWWTAEHIINFPVSQWIISGWNGLVTAWHNWF